MEVFRISSLKYSKSLISSGKSSRWNMENQFVIYTGQSRSLSILESVVHHKTMPLIKFEMMLISISDEEHFYTKIPITDLQKNWRAIEAYSNLQEIGSAWYMKNKSLILQVPSVIVPQEFNFIINTSHPDFNPSNVTLSSNEDYF